MRERVGHAMSKANHMYSVYWDRATGRVWVQREQSLGRAPEEPCQETAERAEDSFGVASRFLSDK